MTDKTPAAFELAEELLRACIAPKDRTPSLLGSAATMLREQAARIEELETQQSSIWANGARAGYRLYDEPVHYVLSRNPYPEVEVKEQPRRITAAQFDAARDRYLEWLRAGEGAFLAHKAFVHSLGIEVED